MSEAKSYEAIEKMENHLIKIKDIENNIKDLIYKLNEHDFEIRTINNCKLDKIDHDEFIKKQEKF